MTGQNSQRNRGAEWSSRSTSCPSGKWSYPSRRQAKEHASRMRRMRGDNLRPYRCLTCNLWHVGHKPKVAMTGEMSSSEFHALNAARAAERRAKRAEESARSEPGIRPPP